MSADQKVPICYFASTVVFIGGNSDITYPYESKLIKHYQSPKDALLAITTNQRSEDSLQNGNEFLAYLNEPRTPSNLFTMNPNLAAIHSEVYNPSRFSEVSVVVVEQTLQEMSGIQFCKNLENSPAKRILLIEQNEEQNAIQAKENGIIDHYVVKNIPGLNQRIHEAINSAKTEYFHDMSELILKMLALHAPECLSNHAFVEFFKQLLHEDQIVEYYLTDNSGSFLMLDRLGNMNYLLLRTENDLALYYDYACIHQAPSQILKQLQSGMRIPFLWPQQTNLTHQDWDDLSTSLYPAQKIAAENSYFYSYVKKAAFSDIQPKRIFTLENYLGCEVESAGANAGVSMREPEFAPL